MGDKQTTSEVAAPKPVIDHLLYEKFGWLPNDVDDIPKFKMDELMMVLNTKSSSRAEFEAKSNKEPESMPTIGSKMRNRVLA